MSALPLLILLPLASIPTKEALPLPPPPAGTSLVQGAAKPTAEDPDAEGLALPPPPQGLKLLQPVEKRALVQTGLAAGEDEGDSQELEELRALEQVALDEAAAEASALLQTMRTFGPAHPLRLRLEDVLEDGDHREGAQPELGLVRDLMAFDVGLVRDRYDIPVEMQPLVAHYIRFFQGPGRSWFKRWMARSTRYLPVMQPILEQYGLPKDTVYVAMIESGFSTRAYSWAHAAGPWQFIPATGKEYGLRQDYWVDERRDPIKATHAAARFLGRLHRDLGHWYLAWAGYNTGGARVRRLVEKRGTNDFWTLIEGRGLMPETQHYVPKVIAAALVHKNPTAFGFSEDEFDFMAPLEFETVQLTDAYDLQVIAQAAGTTEEALYELNPELNRWSTPPASAEQPYSLRLPLGTPPQFAENLSKIPAPKRVNYVEHKVRRGDTLSRIAHLHGTTVDAISKFNRLPGPRSLKVNSVLMIPVPRPEKPRLASTAASAAEQQRSARRAADTRAAQATPAPARATGNAAGKPATSLVAASTSAKRGTIHVLARGETLWSISQRYGVSVNELKAWNGIRNHKNLQAGQKLKVASP